MLTFMRRIALHAGLAVLASGLILPLSGWVFHLDDRRPSQSPMVGRLSVDLPQGHGEGTAVVVGQCGILTAFHVVFGPWYVTAIEGPSHSFVAEFTLTSVTLPDGSHPSTRATPVLWGDYRGPERQFRHPGEDWVYLVLDDCLGFRYGHVNIRPLEDEEFAPNTLEFSTIGYSSGGQMVDPRCNLRGDDSAAKPGAWSHDCVLLPGDSGGPIFKRNTMTLVALGSGAVAKPGELSCSYSFIPGVRIRHEGATDCMNLAVPITPDVLDRVIYAETATSVQRSLLQLGYDAGTLGVIDGPKAKAAIEQAQRDMGFHVTGEPTAALWKILVMRSSLN